MNTELTVNPVNLPEVTFNTAPMLKSLTTAFGVSRDILASDEEIQNVWQNLEKLLNNIPPEKRDKRIVQMCAAVAMGLFDSAVNYVWNAVIIELRERVRRFGLRYIPKIINKKFDEQKLTNMRDVELLSLCYKINLISKEGFLMLNQCREIRNKFSAAHPADGVLNDYEIIVFINRCCRHVLNTDMNTKAIDIKKMLGAIKVGGFSSEQVEIWRDRIEHTYDDQKKVILVMLYGIYCSPQEDKNAQATAIELCNRLQNLFSSDIISELINLHQEYNAEGKKAHHSASLTFFANLNLTHHLSAIDRHSVISSTCKNLIDVHNEIGNTINERPFAEQLEKLSAELNIPEAVRYEFVKSIVICSVGNQFNIDNEAQSCYHRIIRKFSASEIEIMLSLLNQEIILNDRIEKYPHCKKKFKELVGLLDENRIPSEVRAVYEQWV